jgi:hypothetical protein
MPELPYRRGHSKKMAAERYICNFRGVGPSVYIHFPHYEGKKKESAYGFIFGHELSWKLISPVSK